MGELLAGQPMFAGTSTMNQLDKIVDVTGIKSTLQARFPTDLCVSGMLASEKAVQILKSILQKTMARSVEAVSALPCVFVI